MALIVTVDHNFPETQEALKKIESYLSDPPLSDAGKDLLATMTKKMDAGLFAPLADSTLAIRRFRGKSSSKPLVDSGSLRRSLKSQILRKATVQIGTNDSRADVLRLGGVSSGFLPGKRIPPREFLDITKSMVEGVIKSLFDGLRKL